jgi:hypothetical protein
MTAIYPQSQPSVMSTTSHGSRKSSWETDDTDTARGTYGKNAGSMNDTTQPLNGSASRTLKSTILTCIRVVGLSIIASVCLMVVCSVLFVVGYGLWAEIRGVSFGKHITRTSINIEVLEVMCRAIREELPGKVIEFADVCGDIWADEGQDSTAALVR